MKSFAIARAASLGLLLMASAALAQTTAPAANAPAPSMTGTMEIKYVTRTPADQEDGKPKVGAQDQYNVNLTVNGTNRFAGVISRQPRIKGMGGLRTLQQPRFDYRLDVFVKVGGQERTVGQWVGPLQVDESSGAYNLTAEGDRALRMAVTAGSGFEDRFGGIFYGKAEDKTKLSFASITRVINGKTVEKKFTADPMRFENVVLAKGPNPSQYPSVSVNGELTYDRETANYYAKNLKIGDDIVTGTIKWVEDPQRASNGKGFYEFNLRFNEEKNQPKQTDAQAFGGMSDDDLFFAVDNAIPSLNGRIEYVDTLSGEQVTSSKVTYNLTSNKLSNQQVMNFAKLWLVAIGPTNDE